MKTIKIPLLLTFVALVIGAVYIVRMQFSASSSVMPPPATPAATASRAPSASPRATPFTKPLVSKNEDAPPVPPFWARPTKSFRYEITETAVADPAKVPSAPPDQSSLEPKTKVISIVKTTDVIYQKVKTAEQQIESWRTGPLQYNVTSGTDGGTFSPTDARESNYIPIAQSNLNEFSWVDRKYFREYSNVAGSRCAVYVMADDMHESPAGNAAQPIPGILPSTFLSKNVRVACIDAQTKFPRMLQDGFVVRKYDIAEIPDMKQTLPQPLQEACDAISKANRSFYQSPARP